MSTKPHRQCTLRYAFSYECKPNHRRDDQEITGTGVNIIEGCRSDYRHAYCAIKYTLALYITQYVLDLRRFYVPYS